MRLTVGLLACLSLAALSQVRAADPAPQSTPAAKADKAAITDADRKAMAQGYKVSMMRGEKYYCRNEAIVGTRFDRKVCMTPEQMAATQQKSQDDVERLQKSMQAAKGG
jgi:hypothetical protein